MFAFTWNITPFDSKEAVVKGLLENQARVQARRFVIAKGRTPPRRVKRVGVEVIEAIFCFETALGRGKGVLAF